MLENKEQEKIAGIISDFFDGAVNEADIDILAMKIYEKYVAKLEQDLEFTTKTANELIEIKHKLEQELAELKEKAIVPKFKFDEECVVIMFGSYHFHRFIAQVKDDLCLTQPYNDTEEWYYVKPEMVFKTLEEAQAKLKEIQGNE